MKNLSGKYVKLPNESGYSTDTYLSADELDHFRQSIYEQWFYRIQLANPAIARRIYQDNIPITSYHLISRELEHSQIWSKNSRILPPSFTKWFMKSNFINELSNLYGDFIISDEDNLGWPNIYWRLVRPNQKNDVGPLHRDSWFWELNKDFPTPNYNFYRLKVWISLFIEPGLNGLKVEPCSQRREDIRWKGELRNGIQKPILLSEEKELSPILLETGPGQSIVFNDNLIHGGALNKGSNSRVSVEFTMLVRE